MNIPNIKFDGNVSSGSRADTCGQTDIDGQTDMTKLTGTFVDYANAPANHSDHVLWRRDCCV